MNMPIEMHGAWLWMTAVVYGGVADNSSCAMLHM
jgi:hypothetical protein